MINMVIKIKYKDKKIYISYIRKIAKMIRDIFECKYCKYTTLIKCNMIRHQNAKHKDKIFNKVDVNNFEANVNDFEANVHVFDANVHVFGENVNSSKFMCKKCNKLFKTEKYHIEHEKKCNGVDSLTCPRCMKSFLSRQAKCNHVKRNTCEPKSIENARIPNIQNIQTQNIIQNQSNIQTQNNVDKQINNNFYINNYGSERNDYFDFNKYLELCKKAYDIPSYFTKELHFNEKFPENHNIKYLDTQTALIKQDDGFQYKNLQDLVEELISRKTLLMKKFVDENKNDICTKHSLEVYEDVFDIIIKLLDKQPKDKYRIQINKIKCLIKNST